jgi:hypothetical protein
MSQKILLFILIILTIACTSQKKDNLIDSNLNEVIQCKSLDGLILKYGVQNVINKTSWIIGDDTLYGSIIFPNSPKEAFIYYHDGKIIDVTIKGENSNWKTQSGLFLGMSLLAVQQVNNKNFTISGFNWAHGGSVVSWEGGKLTGDSTLSHLATFSNVKNEHRGISFEAYKLICGEAEFDVRHADIQKLNPKLDLISIVIPQRPSKSEGMKIGSHIKLNQIPR